MVGYIIAVLRQSSLVRDLEIVEMIDEARVQHHKHDGERIGPSARVLIEDVLAELAARLQSKGQV